MKKPGKKILSILAIPEPEEEQRVWRKVLQEAGGMPFPSLTPEEILHMRQAGDKINEILKTLSPREELIVRRCVMNGETRDKVAKYFGTTEERIRAIEGLALRKLRHPKNSKLLQEFAKV